MPVHDNLGKRMKEFYEQIPKTKLMRRTPVIIRIDGKAFHSYTRNLERPFDDILMTAMQKTMKYLCENIQGCVLGYTQSDEITLVLVDYKELNSAAWFDYEVQKLCSISASMATMAFNKAFLDAIDIAYNKEFDEHKPYVVPYVVEECNPEEDEDHFHAMEKKYEKYYSKVGKAMFDARCFNIPKEEVTNCLYWRQLDATRNSIQMVGQANFSHKELHGKSCNNIQDMLMTQKGINWNAFPTYQKRGSCCIKNYMVSEPDGCRMYDIKADEHEWIIDREVPIFKGEGRKYIDRLIYVGE